MGGGDGGLGGGAGVQGGVGGFLGTKPVVGLRAYISLQFKSRKLGCLHLIV